MTGDPSFVPGFDTDPAIAAYGTVDQPDREAPYWNRSAADLARCEQWVQDLYGPATPVAAYTEAWPQTASSSVPPVAGLLAPTPAEGAVPTTATRPPAGHQDPALPDPGADEAGPVSAEASAGPADPQTVTLAAYGRTDPAPADDGHGAADGHSQTWAAWVTPQTADGSGPTTTGPSVIPPASVGRPASQGRAGGSPTRPARIARRAGRVAGWVVWLFLVGCAGYVLGMLIGVLGLLYL